MAAAPQTTNVGTRGQDARYDVSGLQPIGNDRYIDDQGYVYQSNGLSDNRPNTFVPGLPPADNNGAGGIGPGGGGGGGAPGGFSGAAINSPYYQQALAATQAAEAADASARKAAIQQMLIQFGLVPQGYKDPYGDVDQTTRDLATSNTASGISVAARLKQALADTQRDSSRQLAAKGLRRSGARGYQMRRSQLGYDQNYSDAVAKLLGGAQGIYSGFAQGQYGRNMGLAGALRDAINSLGSWYQPSGGGGGSYTPQTQSYQAPSSFTPEESGAWGSPTIGGGTVGGGQPNFNLGGGSGTSSKKPLLMPG